MEFQLKRTKELLTKFSNVLILLHQYPDGDTIASSIALATCLRRMGKNVDLAVKESIPEVFNFLIVNEKIRNDFLLGDYELIIAVDCGDAMRTGFPLRVEKIAKSRPFINIDHHLRNSLHKIATVNLVDEKAAAAAEVVYQLINHLGQKIDSKIATFILAGIYYDTGGFQHANVTEQTLQVASECLRLGGRIGLISKNQINSKSPSGLKLWGIALKKMKILDNGVISTIISLKDIKEAGAKLDDASGIVNLINSVPRCKMAILFLETPDGKIKASLRTEADDVDVSLVARLFGGGGHRKAAGFTLEGELAKNIV